MNASAALARFAAQLRFEDIPALAQYRDGASAGEMREAIRRIRSLAQARTVGSLLLSAREP